MLLDPAEVDAARLCSDAVQGGDCRRDETSVAMLVEPVECRACGPGAIEARRTDEHELVGSLNDPLRGRAEHTWCGVETEEVVVALEQTDRLPDRSAPDRLRDLGTLVSAITSSRLDAWELYARTSAYLSTS